ncbi:hypothetical protein [Streptomyces hainanensis]|nr:hypothetical protein [Streptomyces hainanensis]
MAQLDTTPLNRPRREELDAHLPGPVEAMIASYRAGTAQSPATRV